MAYGLPETHGGRPVRRSWARVETVAKEICGDGWRAVLELSETDGMDLQCMTIQELREALHDANSGED